MIVKSVLIKFIHQKYYDYESTDLTKVYQSYHKFKIFNILFSQKSY